MRPGRRGRSGCAAVRGRWTGCAREAGARTRGRRGRRSRLSSPASRPACRAKDVSKARPGSALLFLGAAAANGAEHDHADQPARVSPGDPEDDDRDRAVDTAGKQEAEREQSSEDSRTRDSTGQRADQRRGCDPFLQTSITWKSATAPSTVPLYTWLNMNRVLGWRFFKAVASSQLMWLKTSPGPVASTMAMSAPSTSASSGAVGSVSPEYARILPSTQIRYPLLPLVPWSSLTVSYL